MQSRREIVDARFASVVSMACDLASLGVMSNSTSARFPVTVTHLPVTRCQICQRTFAYRPGQASSVLTEHYRRAHPEALDVSSR